MTDKLIRQLIYAANSIENVHSTQRRHLLTRSIAVMYELIDRLHLDAEQVVRARTHIQQLALAQVYALRSIDGLRKSFLDAADVIRHLKMIVENQSLVCQTSSPLQE